MKQCEKWLEKQKERTRGSFYSADYRTGWRAALEFVQSRFEFSSKVAYSNDDILMAVKKEIREELEN